MRRVLRHSRGLSPVVGQAQRWQRVWASAAAVASTTPGKVKVHITDRDGRTYQGSYDAGLSLMECLRDDGSLPVDLPGTCGGCCQCATCHVLISSEDGWSTRVSAMMPRSEKEEDLLDTLPHVSRNSRLCCQIHLSADVDGVKIIIPPSAADARMAEVLKRAMPPKP